MPHIEEHQKYRILNMERKSKHLITPLVHLTNTTKCTVICRAYPRKTSSSTREKHKKKKKKKNTIMMLTTAQQILESRSFCARVAAHGRVSYHHIIESRRWRQGDVSLASVTSGEVPWVRIRTAYEVKYQYSVPCVKVLFNAQ
jgi:hypothetical protein